MRQATQNDTTKKYRMILTHCYPAVFKTWVKKTCNENILIKLVLENAKNSTLYVEDVHTTTFI